MRTGGVAGLWRSLLGFTAAQLVLVSTVCWLLGRFMWTDTASGTALRASAWLAVGVQTVTFAVARLTAREHVFAGWGLGVLMRFATVVFWALLGIKALSLSATPALLSLVIFYFVSTLVEPLFLNA